MQKIRNIAVIAHVDHGKTTLVDGLLQQSGTFGDHEHHDERAMDSNDIERERGITILAKNTAIRYGDHKINIIDTPGHADFGGEVERVLKMVDGALILVDAYEGVMPQTKFVVKKMLQLGLTPIVVVNKIDKPEAECDRVVDEVFDLFVAMGATDEQQDFKVVYAAARDGVAKLDMDEEDGDFSCLFEAIINDVPEPKGDKENPAQAQVFTLDYDNYVGKIGIARIFNGQVSKGDNVLLAKADGELVKGRISKLIGFLGLNRMEIDTAEAGDIVAFAGLETVIGQRSGSKTIGFGAGTVKNVSQQIGEVLCKVVPGDLLKYGLIPEFIGRLPIVATLDELDEDALVRILCEPKNALIKQYQKLFDMENVTLKFTDGALVAVAQEALKRKTGSRGLRSILDNAMLDVMYDIPSQDRVREVVVNEDVILKGNQPLIIYEHAESA